MTEFIDMDITGASKMPGGEYKHVDISGAGKIEGNLRCEALDISGSGKVNGDVVCTGDVDCSGAAKIHGGLEAGSLDASGAFTVEGYCEVHGTVDTSGAAKFESALRAQDVDASGSLTCAGDVSAERFVCDGVCHIDGLLNAESIELRLQGDSVIRDLGGADIRVRGKHGFRLFGRGVFGCLHTNSVEGDTVDLECTEAAVVRGKRVRIGANCQIRRVEYSESFDRDPSAVIDETVAL